ncbi:hypothetical protein L3Y34_010939 [Caenorhabditis briggsae]|uniref:Uncharacterized protein n=1 Tax=Caenorhabditis briggsae TaxID=6238 RepID=A0AAE9CTD0_CAEBR|nr:hypothetical protein L3Y34_010939 [Caenorhabditis briggsae]
MKLALLVVAVAMLGSVAYSIEGDYYDYPVNVDIAGADDNVNDDDIAKELLPSDDSEPIEGLDMEKRLYINRGGFRPVKRSMAIGRAGMRPGKRGLGGKQWRPSLLRHARFFDL